MKSDKSYAEKLFTDYAFAQNEFTNANLKIDPNSFQQLSNAYRALESAVANTFGKDSRIDRVIPGPID